MGRVQRPGVLVLGLGRESRLITTEIKEVLFSLRDYRNNMELKPVHFFDHPIEALFDTPPAREKTPDCPNGFVWNDQVHRVVELMASWSDFTRRGRAARNMRPSHAAVAAGRGSLGVGRFYFRVKVDSGRVFDIYYDRAPRDADHRKGQWFIYRELTEGGEHV